MSLRYEDRYNDKYERDPRNNNNYRSNYSNYGNESDKLLRIEQRNNLGMKINVWARSPSPPPVKSDLLNLSSNTEKRVIPIIKSKKRVVSETESSSSSSSSDSSSYESDIKRRKHHKKSKKSKKSKKHSNESDIETRLKHKDKKKKSHFNNLLPSNPRVPIISEHERIEAEKFRMEVQGLKGTNVNDSDDEYGPPEMLKVSTDLKEDHHVSLIRLFYFVSNQSFQMFARRIMVLHYYQEKVLQLHNLYNKTCVYREEVK